MSGEVIRGVVAAYFERLNGEDWDGLVALFAADVELRAPGAGHRRGRAAIADYFRSALAPYPEHHDEPRRVVVGDATATVEIRFTGRLANGRTLEFDAVDVFDVKNGEITALSSWYDSHAVRGALLEARAADSPPSAVDGHPHPLGSVGEVTPARLRAALALVRRGVAFRLDLPLDQPAVPLFGRELFRHSVFALEDWSLSQDDRLDNFNTQVSSHWDGLRHHTAPDGSYYGGRTPEQVGIDLWAAGICTRAVLLDVERHLGLRWDERRAIAPAELDACAERQGVELRPGDALLLHTGWLRGFLAAPAERRSAQPPAPGLAEGDETVAWLRERRFAAVAADNPGLEALPGRQSAEMLHVRMLPELGLAVGELWWLEELRADCAEDDVWEALLVSVPLNLRGGCGSPANAIALK